MDLEELKTKALNDIVDVLIANVENQTLQEAEITPIADFVLKRIEEVKNSMEIEALLVDLSQNWPIFQSISRLHEGEEKERADKEVADGVLALAQSGKIDEAIDLAKTATQN